MEELSLSNTSEIVNCAACYKQVGVEDSFCDTCGYPLKGTEQEQNYFMAVRNSKSIDLEAANAKVKKAGNVLYWIAGLTFVWALFSYFSSKDSSILIVNSILAGIYVGLAAWSSKKPMAAIISGASLYVLVFVLNGIVEPVTLLKGIVVKIFIIIMFVKAIQSAIEADKLKKELNIE